MQGPPQAGRRIGFWNPAAGPHKCGFGMFFEPCRPNLKGVWNHRPTGHSVQRAAAMLYSIISTAERPVANANVNGAHSYFALTFVFRFFSLAPETRRRSRAGTFRNGNAQEPRRRDAEKLRCGDAETVRSRDAETPRRGEAETLTS